MARSPDTIWSTAGWNLSKFCVRPGRKSPSRNHYGIETLRACADTSFLVRLGTEVTTPGLVCHVTPVALVDVSIPMCSGIDLR
jgi:hypothetical protein